MTMKPIESISELKRESVHQVNHPKVNVEQGFQEALERAKTIRFSNHAQNRLQKREISLSDDGLRRLSEAIDQVERRGGHDSLILMDGIAFIVNVQNRLIVTAVDANSRRGGVFTQIDSVVLADSRPKLDQST